MTLLLGILKAYWKEIFIVLVIVGAILYVKNLNSTIDDLKSKNLTLVTANKIYEEDNKKLRGSIDVVNQALTNIAKGTADTQKNFVDLSKKVTAQQSALSERLARILKDPKPKTCEDTMRYLVDAVRDYKQ